MTRAGWSIVGLSVLAGCGFPPFYCERGLEWYYQCNYTLEKAGEEPISTIFDDDCDLIAADPAEERAWRDRYSALDSVDTSNLYDCREARDTLFAEWEPWE